MVIGGGSFGTSIANMLAVNDRLNVQLLVRDKNVFDQINQYNLNPRYLPTIKLRKTLKASLDCAEIKQNDIIFLALPSSSIVDFVKKNDKYFSDKQVVVNLSKGFGKAGKSIAESIRSVLNVNIVSMKGPTFAIELIKESPSAFTLASDVRSDAKKVEQVFSCSNLYFDYSNQLEAVELVSILKNIYAIAVGIVDAKFAAANTQSMVLTNCVNEIRTILAVFCQTDSVIFNYCGLGDLALTALNDLSRNRTLGLLLGKGFYSSDTTASVILEGIRSINIVYELVREQVTSDQIPILKSVYKLLNNNLSIESATQNLIRNVITI